MIITAIFKNQGVPATGLTPTIDIYNVTGSVQVVTAAAMSEVGGGIYRYDFAAFNPALDYAVVCDGGSSLGNADRYAAGGTTVEGMAEQILADTAEMQTDLANGGRLDLLVDGIKAKTDLIPADPADQSQIEAAIAAAEANIRGAAADTLGTLSDQIDAVDTVVDAIKLKTDSLPADPASQAAVLSAVSTSESNIRGADSDTLKGLSDQIDAVQAQTDLIPATPVDQLSIEAALAAVEANIRGIDGDTLKIISDQIDAVDAVADAIKLKTDSLPPDPAAGSSVVAAISAAQAAIIGGDGDSLELLSDQLDSNLSAIQAVQNNTTIRIDVPARLVRPDVGAKTYRIILGLYDTNGNPEVPDSAPSIQIENVSGSERLAITFMTQYTGQPGQYYYDYAIASVSALEILVVTIGVTEGGVTTYHRRSTEVTEFEADLNEVQANVSAIKARTDLLPANTATELSTIQGSVAGVQNSLDSGVSGLAAIKAVTDAIQAKTTNLPDNTASELNAIDGDNATIIALLQNASYGLSALRVLIEAIDTSAELAARFNEIKGAGWATETLTGLDALLDAIKARTDFLPVSTIAELNAIDVSIAGLATDVGEHDTDIKTLLQNATYGLSALRTLLDTINADTTSGVQAMFDEIKGVGWMAETLVALDGLLDSIKNQTDRLPADPASQSRVGTAISETEGRLALAHNNIFAAIVNPGEQLTRIETAVGEVKEKTDNLPTNTAVELSDIETLVGAINAATSEAGIPADIQAMITNLQNAVTTLINAVQADVTFIRDIEGGRWRIVGTQMVFYKEDNVTEVARFNLFDVNGSESASNVFERQRV